MNFDVWYSISANSSPESRHSSFDTWSKVSRPFCFVVVGHSLAICLAARLSSQATFFSSHCSQSSFEKLLEIPFSTTPYEILAVLAYCSDPYPYVEQDRRRDVHTSQTVGLEPVS